MSFIPNLMSILFPDLGDSRIDLQIRQNRLKKVEDPMHLTEAAREDIIHLCREFESGTSQWGQWEAVLEEFHKRHKGCRWCSIEDLHYVYMRSKMSPQTSL